MINSLNYLFIQHCVSWEKEALQINVFYLPGKNLRKCLLSSWKEFQKDTRIYLVDSKFSVQWAWQETLSNWNRNFKCFSKI